MSGKHFPLVYTFDDVFQGHEFVARVETSGLCLMAQSSDEGEVWVDAVHPAGFSAGGENQPKAILAFKKEYQYFLRELVQESASGLVFQATARSILGQICEQSLADWNAAHELVRQGELDSDWLRRETGSHAARYRVRIFNEESADLIPDQTEMQDLGSGVWSQENEFESALAA